LPELAIRETAAELPKIGAAAGRGRPLPLQNSCASAAGRRNKS